MIFFSAPLTTRVPPTTVRRPSDDRPPAVRQPSTVPTVLRYLLFLPDTTKISSKKLVKTGLGFSKFLRPNGLHFSNFFAPHFVQNFGGALRENVWWRVVSLWENKHHETHHQKLAEFFRKFGSSFRIFLGPRLVQNFGGALHFWQGQKIFNRFWWWWRFLRR